MQERETQEKRRERVDVRDRPTFEILVGVLTVNADEFAFTGHSIDLEGFDLATQLIKPVDFVLNCYAGHLVSLC